MHKLFKHTTLMNIFFAVLMSIPLISIGVRCAYVTLNKNAYQSYYGETINQKELVVLQDRNEIINNLVYYRNATATTTEGNTEVITVYFNQLTITENLNTGFTNENLLISKYMIITTYPTNTITTFYDENNNDLGFVSSSDGQFIIQIFITNLSNNNILRNQNFYIIEYNNYSYLDNVFEYSINQFISSNDVGNLNFFTWFNGVFFTNNAQASTYINFINWYMNYMLLVSCGYILLMMLMWFVNLARKILDRSLNIYDK